MTSRYTSWILGGLLLMGAHLMAQQPKQAAVDLQAAIRTETVTRDLKGAIQQYEAIVAKYPKERAIAADALIHMAACYQKLGDADSHKAYERVIKEFADQKGAVAIARAALGGSPLSKGTPTTTVVWQAEGSPIPNAFPTSISADGRYLSFFDFRTRSLVVRDLSAGTNRVIVPLDKGDQVANHPSESTVSRDATQVAFVRSDAKLGREELWLTDLRGDSKPRRVYGDPGVPQLEPADWSPDGKWIATWLFRKQMGTELAIVSVETGHARVLKHAQSASPVRFSPDSRYIAYNLPQDTSGATDVWVTALDGSTDSAVVTYRGNDGVMGWSPDGQRLLVASDSLGATQLMSVAIQNGKVQGTPQVLKADMGRSAPLGVAADGALFYFTMRDTRGGSIQVAEFDPGSGSVTSRHDVSANPQEDNVNPTWSPDGKYLAYLSKRGRPGAEPVIVIRTAATGQVVREINAKIRRQILGGWHPDGKSLMVYGQDINEQFGAFRVDVETGEASFLMASIAGNGGFTPIWSVDGRAIYHWKDLGDQQAFFSRDVATGTDKEILRRPFLRGVALSPDGRFLATDTRDPATKESVLLLVPLDGTAPREVMRRPAAVAAASWLADSQSFIARVARAGGDELWRVPIGGGSPQKLSSIPEGNVFKFTISPDGRRVAYRVEETAAPTPIQLLKYSNFLGSSSATRK